MKKTLSVLLILVLGCSVVFGQAKAGKKPLIGVSIWSSTDTLGSQCKRILDAAAKALDVNIMYVDQGHISEQVTASAEQVAASSDSVRSGMDRILESAERVASRSGDLSANVRDLDHRLGRFRITPGGAVPSALPSGR